MQTPQGLGVRVGVGISTVAAPLQQWNAGSDSLESSGCAVAVFACIRLIGLVHAQWPPMKCNAPVSARQLEY
jgi:hypothetical protein